MNELKKLSTWAKENNMSYKQAWNSHQAGTLPVKTKETKTGRIMVESNASQELPKQVSFATPVWAESKKEMKLSTASSDPVRGNRVSKSIDEVNQFYHIEHGVEPFVLNNKKSFWDINWVIYLCQKTYWNFSIFRNIIDAMTDFSVSKIYFRGGNAKSRKFFQDLNESVNMLGFQDKFFREYYRSGNSFIYRFESVPIKDDLSKLNKTYAANASVDVKLPSRYIILNPCDISVQANIAFANAMMFFKRLNGYEIHRLRYAAQNPDKANKEEIDFLNSLPKITQDQIKAGAGSIIVPLDPDILYAVFYKKQDYEPLAVPMGWPVLRDIEWKSEMKAIDMAVSRTMNNVILLIKMGYESKEGEYMVDQTAISNMQTLFKSESVGKTLVADFTTEAEFVIPAIGDFLDPKKYQIVNEDIKQGLNYILTGTGEKFANQNIQVKLFIERLKQARESFLTYFLIPEIKRLSKAMGFKGAPPVPYFEDIDLKDESEFNRIVAQLYQYGLLTPEEAFSSLETGRIPTGEESAESQAEFKQYKDKGFYQPIIGGPANQMQLAKQTGQQQMDLQQNNQEHDLKMTKIQHKHDADNPPPAPPPSIHINAPTKAMPQANGRPNGTKRPQSTKRVKPMKGSQEYETQKESPEAYSLTKIKDNLILSSKLNNEIEKYFLTKHNLNELSKEQKEISEEIKNIIMANEDSDKWLDENILKSYIENPINKNQDKLMEIDKISYNHQIEQNLAAILYNSKTKAP
jgi:hypothetical protein